MKIKDKDKLKQYCRWKYSDKLVIGPWDVRPGEYLPEWQQRYNTILASLEFEERHNFRFQLEKYDIAGISIEEYRDFIIHNIIEE